MNAIGIKASGEAPPIPTPVRLLHFADSLITRAGMRKNNPNPHDFYHAVRRARDALNDALFLVEEMLDRGTYPYPPDGASGSFVPPSYADRPEEKRYGTCPACGRPMWTSGPPAVSTPSLDDSGKATAAGDGP